jgi:glucose/mannose-6-phosphate isomerase
LIDKTSLEKFDSQGIHKVYDMWPEIAKKSYFSNLSQMEYKKWDHIVFAGMEGSGAIGDIFSAILSKTSTYVHQYLIIQNKIQ